MQGLTPSACRGKPTEEALRRGNAEREAQARREAEAQGAKLRQDFEAMPVEQQAKAFDLMHKRLAQGREAKLNRVIRKAAARHERRSRVEWEIWEAKPKPPTGLLASFQRPGYETALSRKELEV